MQVGDKAGQQVAPFDYDPSRAGNVPRRPLQDYGGYLISERYRIER